MQKTKKLQKCLSKALLFVTGVAITSPAWALFQVVPEPNTLALFGAGVISAILIARYKAKK